MTIALLFSEDIGGFDAADLGLKRARGRRGTSRHYSPDTVSYEAASRTATITYSRLRRGHYTLVVFEDDIFANGKRLDGETDSEAWWDEVSLPSGDGQPGGNAALRFTVSPAGFRRFLSRPSPDRPARADRWRAAWAGAQPRPARR